MKVLNIAKKMIEYFDNPAFCLPTVFCPQLSAKARSNFWPPPKKGTEIPEETLGLALKWFETRFKLQGFNYKVSKKTNQLTLL